jgi:TetR/AcrR family transcriptional regulator
MATVEEKIRQAAIKEFSRYGFEGSRVDRIAKTAKINKAMIYYHYKSKEKLYEAILSTLAEGINNSVKNIIEDGNFDKNKLYTLVSTYIDFFCNIDPDFTKIMLREISSGGNYFRKIIYAKALHPLSSILIENISREIKNKVLRPINPFYLMHQIIGSIVFLNMLKINLKGTDLYEIIFKENYIEEFRENLLGILQHGIELKEETK